MSIIDMVLNNQRGVGTHLPATLFAMGPSSGRPVFGNGPAYPTQCNSQGENYHESRYQ